MEFVRMIYGSDLVLSVRDSDFQHVNRVGQRVTPQVSPRQHTERAALHLPCLCVCVLIQTQR